MLAVAGGLVGVVLGLIGAWRLAAGLGWPVLFRPIAIAIAFAPWLASPSASIRHTRQRSWIPSRRSGSNRRVPVRQAMRDDPDGVSPAPLLTWTVVECSSGRTGGRQGADDGAPELLLRCDRGAGVAWSRQRREEGGAANGVAGRSHRDRKSDHRACSRGRDCMPRLSAPRVRRRAGPNGRAALGGLIPRPPR